MFVERPITKDMVNNDFTASQLSDGRWFARIAVAYDADTKRYKYRTIYGKNAKDAVKNMRRFILSEATRREEVQETSELFTTIFEEWLYETKRNKVKGTTFDRYEESYLYQIRPHLVSLKLKDVSKDDLRRVMKASLDKGYSYSTIRKVYRLLSEFFKLQTVEENIVKNPMLPVVMYSREEVANKQEQLRDLRELAQSKKERHMPLSAKEDDLLSSQLAMEDKTDVSFFSDEEIAKIKDAIANGYTRMGRSRSGNLCEYHFSITQGEVFLLMLNTGLRRGEMLALQYCDVDWENKTIGIVKNVVSTKVRDENGRHTGSRKTKTGTVKTQRSYQAYLPINETAIAILRELKSAEPEGYDGYVVHNGDQPLSPTAFAKRFRNLLGGIGITGKGLHTLRHTFASKLYAQTNGNTKLVSELLRHASVSFTMEIYVHLESKYKKITMNDFSI